MAKKKNIEAVDEAFAELSTQDLQGDAANPRKISDESAAGLRASIKRFGDLSGIVFNRRTGELVTGHQRMDQIRAEFGDLPIEMVDDHHGRIRVDDNRFFAVRYVDWSQARQRAANVAANNLKLQGAFTSELSTYLLTIEAELATEPDMAGVLDECLMVELLAAGLDTTEASEEPADDLELTPQYQVVIECANEEEQRKLFERFDGEGLKVKVLTV